MEEPAAVALPQREGKDEKKEEEKEEEEDEKKMMMMTMMTMMMKKKKKNFAETLLPPIAEGGNGTRSRPPGRWHWSSIRTL